MAVPPRPTDHLHHPRGAHPDRGSGPSGDGKDGGLPAHDRHARPSPVSLRPLARALVALAIEHESRITVHREEVTALDPDRITVSFNGSAVCVDGVGTPGAREVDLSPTDIEVAVDLGVGAAQAAIRTTDLSHAYVEENSAYSS